MRSTLRRLLALSALALSAAVVHAETVHIAVAANFTAPAKALAEIFARTSGHQAQLSFGATGAFYTQIKQGAPFDILLAADDERPIRLEKEGDTVPGSRFTYAIGQLVLWSAKPGFVDDQGTVLKGGNFARIAIANPKLAPYGAAAVETMDKLGLTAALQPKLVTGESIGQTYNFIATGNADLGFVALAQVLEGGKLKSGSAWVVPSHLHQPIQQDAILLKPGQGNAAAVALLAFLQSEAARAIIRAYGYDI